MRRLLALSNILVVFLPLACNLPASAASPRWRSLTTPHFEMYTTSSENEAVQEIQFFERIRSVILKTSPLKTTQDSAVQIVAFSSESEYEPYRFQAGGNAYYLRTFNQDYIVLQDISPKHRQLVVHEFTHLAVAHAGLNLPIWLNEGLAELYSSIETQPDEIVVGRPLPQHLATLSHQPWMQSKLLFAVNRDSPYYNEGKKMSIFYAQSWAFTHMLALTPEYAPRFKEFLSAVSAGKESAEALQLVYGKNLAAIEADLKSYVRQKSLPESVFNDKLDQSNLQPQIGAPTDFQINFALATLLSGKPSTLADARARLAALSAQYPEKPQPEESLGFLALQRDQTDEARSHFANAIHRHSTDPEILYRYAELQEDAGADDTETMALLKQAIARKPDFDDARVALGLLAAKNSQFETALSTLSSVKQVPADQAFEVYSTLAQCHLELNHPKPARDYAEKAKVAATTDQEKQDADDLLQDIGKGGKDATQGSTPSTTPIS